MNICMYICVFLMCEGLLCIYGCMYICMLYDRSTRLNAITSTLVLLFRLNRCMLEFCSLYVYVYMQRATKRLLIVYILTSLQLNSIKCQYLPYIPYIYIKHPPPPVPYIYTVIYTPPTPHKPTHPQKTLHSASQNRKTAS